MPCSARRRSRSGGTSSPPSRTCGTRSTSTSRRSRRRYVATRGSDSLTASHIPTVQVETHMTVLWECAVDSEDNVKARIAALATLREHDAEVKRWILGTRDL